MVLPMNTLRLSSIAARSQGGGASSVSVSRLRTAATNLFGVITNSARTYSPLLNSRPNICAAVVERDFSQSAVGIDGLRRSSGRAQAVIQDRL